MSSVERFSMKYLLVTVLLFTAVSMHGQIDNPINYWNCRIDSFASNDCQETRLTNNGSLTIDVLGSCKYGYAPEGSQYSTVLNCSRPYSLGVLAYGENDQTLDDNGCLDTIGSVTAEAEVRSATTGTIFSFTYAGEDCEGIPFESAPGSFFESPCPEG